VEFEWDPEKAARNYKKHGVPFAEAATVFGDTLNVTSPDPDHSIEEERYVTVGRSVRGRLLLVENVVVPGNEPSFGKWLDLLMLVYAGGRERTAEEFRDLLATSGFHMERVIPTTANVSVIEALAA